MGIIERQHFIMTIDNTVNQLLANTRDEFTQLTLVEMGITYELTQEKNNLHLALFAGFPCNLLQTTLLPRLKNTLKEAFPELNVHVTLESVIQPHRTQMTGKGLRGIKNTIAIASGKGGVGKSTVTVHLAMALAQQGAKVGILDADIYGPSIPTMLGETAGVTIQNEHYIPAYAHGIQAMSIGYLSADDAALIWRGPMLAKALLQMVDLTHWDDLDYLFIDLPPGTGDIQLSLVQKIPLTGAIVVTTPQQVATQDAQKALTMFNKTNIDVLGVIENMSQHTCSNCGHEEAIFGHGGAIKLCEHFQTTLLGQLPLNPKITARCDQGNPLLTDVFIKTAIKASIELAKRPLNYASKFPPIVVE